MTALAVLAVFWALFFPSGQERSGKTGVLKVRVLIYNKIGPVELSSSYSCRIIDGDKGNILEKDIRLNRSVFALSDGGVVVDNRMRFGKRIKIVPQSPVKNVFSFNGKKYGGDLEIIAGDGKLEVINSLGLEHYLKGVVPREMSAWWPFESLKAQAVVSRSYVISEMVRHSDRDYDVRDDTLSQVYGGVGAERWRTDMAVKRTSGKVLAYAGKVLPAYFHSCCGGYIQDSAVLWGKSLSPLEGKECSYCRISPHFRWSVRMSAKKIAGKLRASGMEIDAINDLKSGLRDRSGRLEYVSVKSRNEWKDIASDDFIKAIGSRHIKSAKIYIRKYPFFYRFYGFGWGHGAGMCQWGAFGMALRWKNMKNILDYYYPGAELSDLADTGIRST
ncbi:MAG: SpoIID/LytB domain-containing protein [Candidatus Omnitrophica bacterium]|nr:SpoIID/LytB domain-containing protein [Candidatus Omnitrophota bacterium]